MPDVNIILGPPGTGKTENLLRIVDQELKSGTPPDRIAFVSFTTKATNEGGYKINYWYGEDVKIYPAEVEVDGVSIKDDANEVYIKFHPELEK